MRVDFPPPTRKVQRLRRLRTRHGSRGRGAKTSGLGGGFGMGEGRLGDAPGSPAESCARLSWLSSALGGTSQEKDAILASPLLAGLTEAPGERSTTSKAKAYWADLQDDHDDGFSDCSTQSPGYLSSALWSDGSGCASDDPAASRLGSGSAEQPWSGSMLARGLMPSLPEVGCSSRSPARRTVGQRIVQNSSGAWS